MVPKPATDAQRHYSRRYKDTERYERARRAAAVFAASRPETFASVERVVCFVGWPRSGHTLVGAMLDAHRDMVIAHELDILRHVEAGLSRSDLYAMAMLRSAEFTALGHQWMGRDYSVPGGAQGATDRPRIIGDKKGGATARRLAKDPELMSRLESLVGVPVHIVTVVRNPIDAINSDLAHRVAGGKQPDRDASTERFFASADAVSELAKRHDPARHEFLNHEDLVTDPRRQIAVLCRSLGVVADDSYLDACAGVVSRQPQLPSGPDEWSKTVLARAATYPFLRR
jgi:hypothetical protein